MQQQPRPEQDPLHTGDDAGGQITSKMGKEEEVRAGQAVHAMELSWPSHSSGLSTAVFPPVELLPQQDLAGLGDYQVTPMPCLAPG